MALKYKASVTGDAIWPEILATPTWHPATGIPTRKLLIKRGDTWEPKTEIIGPGYRAASGLVALVHALSAVAARVASTPPAKVHASQLRAGSHNVEAIQVHHLVPRRHEVLDELLLRVRAAIDFR
jgi:hypothetical protein